MIIMQLKLHKATYLNSRCLEPENSTRKVYNLLEGLNFIDANRPVHGWNTTCMAKEAKDLKKATDIHDTIRHANSWCIGFGIFHVRFTSSYSPS